MGLVSIARVFAILAVVQRSSAANIFFLIYPTFGHITGPANLGELLRIQGHNVTMAIPPKMQAVLAGKGLNLLLYAGFESENKSEVTRMFFQRLFEEKARSLAVDRVRMKMDKILKDQQFLEEIRACKPDLFLVDATAIGRIMVIIPYRLDIPFVFIGSLMRHTSNPILPTVVPNRRLDFTDEMTLTQRFRNIFLEFSMHFRSHFNFPEAEATRIYSPEKPYISLPDLEAKALLWILRQDTILGYSMPTMPNIKRLSHMLPLKREPLPNKFQMFMDNDVHGVVIVSFGSMIDYIALDIFEKLKAAFQKTKYKFVVRHSRSNSTDPDKFLFTNWIPQYELLTHKNTKLFITHCGSNGQQEAVHAGVPMIGFPMFGDQPHNAAKMVRKGFGLRLDLRTFTVEELVSAIEEVITNPEYKARTKKASAIMQAELVPPVEEAAFWINHILTFGADHLRPPGQDMPLWKYLGLDILAVCLFVWHVFLFILFKVLCLSYNWCCGRKEKIKNE